MRTRSRLGGAMLAGLVCATAGCPWRAPVLRLVYDQGTLGGQAYLSEADWSMYSDTENQIGDDFVLSVGRSTITHVTWWGAYADNAPVTDNFTLTVFRDNGSGMPEPGGFWESTPFEAVNRTATSGLVEPGVRNLRIYEYSCSVEGWDLEPDTNYYLSIVNDTTLGVWMWCENGSRSEGNGFAVNRTTWGREWSANTLDMAYQLRSNR